MIKRSYDDKQQAAFCEAIAAHYDTDVVTTKQLTEFRTLHNLPHPYFLVNEAKHRASWGKYRVRGVNQDKPAPMSKSRPTPAAEAVSVELNAQVKPFAPRQKAAVTVTESFIPDVDPNYVPFGFYSDLKNIVRSKIFYPVYITGLSGNGKTLMVEQVCAALQREFIRVNITKETDESDLIGSYELIDGNTIRREGPVVVAMRRGAVLLLDETDYGSERLLCLQPILEGKGYFDKKTGEFVRPTPGFNIMATANTKGKGSDDGRFIGANVLNEAFLERFAITVEQEYPTQANEKKMLEKFFTSLGMEDAQFIDHLSVWADIVRKTYAEGGVDEIISTRRLMHIARAYNIFKNRKKAIELCLNRFDEDVKTSFLDMYTKIDEDAHKDQIINNDSEDDSEALLATIRTAAAGIPLVPPAPIALQGVFGSPLNIANAVAKYGTLVTVDRLANGDMIVTSHGRITVLQVGDYITKTYDVLDMIVEMQKNGSSGVLV